MKHGHRLPLSYLIFREKNEFTMLSRCKKAHSANESVMIKDFLNAIKVYALFAYELGKHHRQC